MIVAQKMLMEKCALNKNNPGYITDGLDSVSSYHQGGIFFMLDTAEHYTECSLVHVNNVGSHLFISIGNLNLGKIV